MRNPVRSTRSALSSLVAMSFMLGSLAMSADWVMSEGQRSATVTNARSIAVEVENGAVDVVKDPSTMAVTVSAEIRCYASTKARADARVKATQLVAERDGSGCARITVRFPPPEVAQHAGESGSDVTVSGDGTVTVGGNGNTVTVGGNGNTVIVRNGKTTVIRGGGSGVQGSSDTVHLTVRAADLDGVSVVSSNGAIRCGGFKGQGSFRTSNGAITIEDHAGPTRFETSNGAVRARGVGTPVEAISSNGALDLALASGADGNVSLRISNGPASLVLPAGWQGRVRASTSNGKIELDGGAAASDVRVDDGEGSMTVGKSPKSTATVESSNGRITVRVGG